jgi:hypothetical protein
MYKGKYIIMISLAFLFNAALFSVPADTTSIIDNIYNYDFIKASERLSRLNEKEPFISESLNLEIKWWMSVEKRDQNQFADFLNTLNQLENSDQNELSDIIFLTYRMRYYACTNKNFMIPLLFLKIQKKLSKVDTTLLQNSSHQAFELFVLYKSFLTLIQNSFLPDKFLADSNKKAALVNNIEFIVNHGYSSNRTIGSYFLMKYYLDVEKDKPKAFSYLTVLHKQYPNNLIFTQLLTN